MLKEIELKNFSVYRTELMGTAIVFIVLFHVPLGRESVLYGLYRLGNVGVDMFLFLSGIGLWFSWVKKTSIRCFLKRRLLRIYPTWLVVSSIFFLVSFNWHNPTVKECIELVGDILFDWSYWRYFDLSFWFVPTIMLFYIFAPFYMKLIQKYPIYRWSPVLMLVLCVVMQWFKPAFMYFWGFEVAWSRIPIFFIGINFGELVKRDERIEPAGRWFFLMTFVLSCLLSIYLELMDQTEFPMFIERLVYIPMSISLMVLLIELYRRFPIWCLKSLTFVGGLTLEIYLLHEHIVLEWIKPMNAGYLINVLLSFVIVIPIAWILHKLLKRFFS